MREEMIYEAQIVKKFTFDLPEAYKNYSQPLVKFSPAPNT